MNSKEYIQTYLANIDCFTTKKEFEVIITKCFQAFFKEFQQNVKDSIRGKPNTRAIQTKLIEADKKWKAIADGLNKKIKILPEQLPEDSPYIDRISIEVFKRFFPQWLKQELPLLHNLLQIKAVNRNDCLTDKNSEELIVRSWNQEYWTTDFLTIKERN